MDKPTTPRPARPQGPRVNLTLTPELDRVLERISAAAGTGKASFIREWLITSMPALAGLATALEQAQAGNLEVFGTMAQVVSDSREQLDQAELNFDRTRRAVKRKARKT